MMAYSDGEEVVPYSHFPALIDADHLHAEGCANQGLDIDLDLAGVENYAGLARQANDASYYILGNDGFVWSDALTEPASINVWVEQE